MITVAQPVLALDFGTATTSAVLVRADGARPVVEPGEDRRWWPSAVAYDSGGLVAGSDATARRELDPLSVRTEFKSLLAEDGGIPLGDKMFDAEDLVVVMLDALCAEAARMNGGPITRAVLTVPASYHPTDARWRRMLSAAERAGLVETELLPEPVAAGFAPVSGTPPAPGQVVLVYDLGGGTFDTALVRIGEGRTREVLADRARDGCGGRDIDVALARILRERGGAELEAALAKDRAVVWPAVVAAAREAKHRLSATPSWTVTLPITRTRVEIDRSDLHAAAGPVLAATVECCRAMLDSAADTRPDLVLLVGGSSRMPLVADTVRSAFPLQVRTAVDPSTAVVTGAAVWAASGTGRSGQGVAPDRSSRPLRWDLPGGAGTLLSWYVEEGESVDAGAELGCLRLTDGTLWRLAVGRAGTVRARHRRPGELVDSRDWLVTVGPPGQPADPVAATAGPTTAAPVDGRTVARHDAPVTAVAWTPAGLVVSAGQDSRLRITGDDASQTLPGLGQIWCLAADPRRPLLATGTADGHVTVFEVGRPHPVHSWHEGDGIVGLAFTGRGDALVSVTIDGVLRLWSTRGRQAVWIADATPAAPVATLAGDLLLVGRNLHSAAHGGVVGELHGVDVVRGLATTPDGTTVVACCDEGWAVWQPARSPSPLATGSTDTRVPAAPTADGTTVVTGHPDGSLRWCAVADGREIARAARHDGPVTAVAVGPDGRVASGGRDGAVVVG